MGNIKGKHLYTVMSLGLLAALLYLSDVNSIAATLKRVSPSYIAWGIGLWAAGVYMRIFRWDYLLKAAGVRVTLKDVAYVFLVGFYLANATPGRIGDPVRSLLLKRHNNVPVSASLPSIVVERAVDMLVLVVLGALTLLFLPAGRTNAYIQSALLLFVVSIAAMAYAVSSRKRFASFISLSARLLSKIPFVRLPRQRIISKTDTLFKAFQRYKNKTHLLVSLLLSFLIWVTVGLISGVAFLAVGTNVPLIPLIGITSISILVGVLSFLPGGLGSTEISSVLLFVTLGFATLPQASAAVLLARIMSYWVYVAVGSIAATKIR
ncbi:MAG: flippase-like domain-containing protein [Candidatus Aenigmarchaeota archaeon]|nr:flippase-like domain-containing protein [Candidatus Aenigmarchaeota archaeon]